VSRRNSQRIKTDEVERLPRLISYELLALQY